MNEPKRVIVKSADALADGLSVKIGDRDLSNYVDELIIRTNKAGYVEVFVKLLPVGGLDLDVKAIEKGII